MLDREQVGDEEAILDDEDDDGFLKAFKVYFIISIMYMNLCIPNVYYTWFYPLWLVVVSGGVLDFFSLFMCVPAHTQMDKDTWTPINKLKLMGKSH